MTPANTRKSDNFFKIRSNRTSSSNKSGEQVRSRKYLDYEQLDSVEEIKEQRLEADDDYHQHSFDNTASGGDATMYLARHAAQKWAKR